jgi:hypothetical protein
LRAQLEQARARADFESERVLAAKLARLLVARGSSLDEATRLARRSLLMGEDPKLREELSAWFASTGELSLAAGTLEILFERAPGRPAAWVRVAILRARAGDARAAMRALRAAFEAEPRDPLPLELLGGLHSWAPELVSPSRASQALLEAAKRRQARGDQRGFAEALLQAIEADPAAGAAADRLARHLASAGRFQAADEVWRACASATHAPEVHDLRVREALGARDPALAFAATLDARADTRLDADAMLTAASIVRSGAGQIPVPNFDGLLAPLGLTHLLAARLVWLSERETESTATRARCLVAAGVLFSRSDSHLSGGLLSEASAAAPGLDEPISALLELADRSGDGTWVAEALIRVGRGALDESAARRLSQLAELAEQRFLDPHLGLWALERLSQARPLTSEQESQRARFLQTAGEATVWLKQADWRSLSLAELRRALTEMRYRPELSGQLASALFEAHRRDPEELGVAQDLERVLTRLGRFDELERFWTERTSPKSAAGGLCGLIRWVYRQGGADSALASFGKTERDLTNAERALLCSLASLEGTPLQRAEGLASLATRARADVSAALHSYVSGYYLSAEDRVAAFHHAELACQANPSAARPIVCCAEVAEQAPPRVATLALERASELVVPRARYCQRLVQLAVEQDEPDVALRWARRWASLLPLDVEASRVLLTRLTESGEAAELAKGLDWFIGQPRPRELLAAELALALVRLTTLDPARGRALAQRALGAFGVAEVSLVGALNQIAETLDDPALRIAVIERLLATASESDAALLLCEAAKLHGRRGDADAAADALARAIDLGAEARLVLELLDGCSPLTTSDGEIRALYCRVECLRRLEVDAPTQVQAYRELGATYWDLAGDREAAIRSWDAASRLDPLAGNETLATDLAAFCGYPEVVGVLREVAAARPAPAGAELLVSSAIVALHDGFNVHAAELAESAVERNPRATEALAVLERSVGEDVAPLQRAYALVDAALLGSFGERALHYRAARQFERRRQHELALQHAVKAFQAVPAEGVAYALMLRLASLLGQDATATSAIQAVAEASREPEQRRLWLDIAARSAGPGIVGRRLRAEVLLRALTVRAESEAVTRVGAAIAAVIAEAPDERPHWEREFDAAVRGLLRGLTGPEDVRTALTAARTSAQIFGNPAQCAAALDRALQLDAGSNALDGCEDLSELLSQNASAARRVIEAVTGRAGEGQPVSGAALTLALNLATRHSPSTLGLLAVTRALTEPPRAEWIVAARELAAGEPALLTLLERVQPREDRLKELWGQVESLSNSSPEAAIELLQRHADASWLNDGDRRELQRCLLELTRAMPEPERVEELLSSRLNDEAWPLSERREFALELIRSLAGRGAHAAALDAVATIERWGELRRPELELAVEVARAGGDAERELRYLEPQKDLASAPGGRRALWRRLWQLHDQLGRWEAAVEDAERLLELGGNDDAVQAFLLEDAERRQDHPRVAHLIEERLKQQSGTAEDYLSVADVYATKLENPSRAVEILESGLDACGESAALLEKLGRLHLHGERPAVAACVFERARRAAIGDAERARLSELACRTYFESGDDHAALRILAESDAAHDSEGLARLRVDILRHSPSAGDLGDALEQLATIATAVPEERAQWLCEAAKSCLEDASLSKVALERAQRAARTAPRYAPAQVLARRLEYAERGAGSPSETLATITELRGLGDIVEPELAELRSFLLAEALDQRVGLGAGQRELEAFRRRHGMSPLVAYGLAERLSAAGRHDEALPLYDVAVEADLRGLRTPGEVIVGAVRCALQAGDAEAVERFSARATALGLDPPVSVEQSLPPEAKDVEGGSLRGELPGGPSPRVRNPQLERTMPSTGGPAASTDEPSQRVEVSVSADPRSLGNTWVSGTPSTPSGPAPVGSSAAPPKPSQSSSTLAPVRSSAPRPAVSARSRSSFPAVRGGVAVTPSMRVTGLSGAPVPSGFGRVVPTPHVRVGASGAPGPGEGLPGRASSESRLSRPPEALFQEDPGPDEQPSVSGPTPQSSAPQNLSEEQLLSNLRSGVLAAGEELIRRLETDPSRRHEVVGVCRQMAALRPGDPSVLARLLRAAVEDNDTVFAGALSHSIAVASDHGSRQPPPPLVHQTVQPDALVRLLRGTPEPALEVLGMLWESAPHLFRQPGAPFEGALRVTNDSLTPLAQLNAVVSRQLGTTRTALFHSNGPRPVEFETVLDQPMRVLVSGPDLADAPDFRYHFGGVMLATHPEYVLLFGLEESEVKALFSAVLAAFGPPGRLESPAPKVAVFAERLWESVPARVQRRLQELTSHPELIEYSNGMRAAVRAIRRAGLFVCGDLWVAVRQVCAQERLDVARLGTGTGLAEACAASPALADLVRFASSAEYAAARWRFGRHSSGMGIRIGNG